MKTRDRRIIWFAIVLVLGIVGHQAGLTNRVTGWVAKERTPQHTTRANGTPGPAPTIVSMARILSDPVDLSQVPTLLIVQELATRGLTKWGCTEAGVATATWHPPTEGSPVVFYRVHLEYYGVSPDTCFTWPIPAWADSVRAKVAGVDAQERQGPWSQWSLWYPITEE